MFSFNDENWKLGFVYQMSYMWIKIKIEANLEEKASRHCRDKQNYFIWTNSNIISASLPNWYWFYVLLYVRNYAYSTLFFHHLRF